MFGMKASIEIGVTIAAGTADTTPKYSYPPSSGK
jgi:hypothetical protein